MTARRIAVVCADPGIAWGGTKGAALHLSAVVGALRGMGVDVSVVAARAEQDASPRAVARAARLFEELASIAREDGDDGTALAPELLALSANEEAERALDRIHAEGPLDAVYERSSLFGIAGRRFARRASVPHLLEVNAPLVDEQARYRTLSLAPLARGIERALQRDADAVLAVSSPLAERAVALGARPERVHVVANGADRALFHPGVDGSAARRQAGFSGMDVVVGFVGGLRPWHGIDTLLSAVERARAEDPRVRLLVAGDGPLADLVRARAATPALAGSVHLAGAVAHADAPRWIAACDIAAAPYDAEAGVYFCPLKVPEALAVGRPVVATDLPALRDAVQEGRTGLLVPAGDVASLAAAILLLARDPERRAELGRAAARDAERRLGWDAVARRILEIRDRCDARESPVAR